LETGLAASLAASLPEPLLLTLRRLVLPCQIFLWYSMYLAFNLVSKEVLNVLPAPFMLHSVFNLTAVVCSVGTLVAVEMSRAASAKGRLTASLPDLRLREIFSRDVGRSWRQGVAQAFTHSSSLAAIGGASLCYAHTAKASEPFFAALIATFIFGKKLSWRVWVSLVPIVGGVAYSSLGRTASGAVGFSLDASVAYALAASIVCACSLAFHNASIKGSLKAGPEESPVAGSPLRVYARVLVRAAPVALALTLAFEGGLWASGGGGAAVAQAAAAMGGHAQLATQVALGGLSFYLYNQMALICLDSLTPLSSSVGNVLKRVFVVGSNVLLMGGAVTNQQLTGFGIAMIGVLFYSLASKMQASAESAGPTESPPPKAQLSAA